MSLLFKVTNVFSIERMLHLRKPPLDSIALETVSTCYVIAVCEG